MSVVFGRSLDRRALPPFGSERRPPLVIAQLGWPCWSALHVQTERRQRRTATARAGGDRVGLSGSGPTAQWPVWRHGGVEYWAVDVGILFVGLSGGWAVCRIVMTHEEYQARYVAM